jgi:hypothetical protein
LLSSLGARRARWQFQQAVPSSRPVIRHSPRIK